MESLEPHWGSGRGRHGSFGVLARWSAGSPGSPHITPDEKITEGSCPLFDHHRAVVIFSGHRSFSESADFERLLSNLEIADFPEGSTMATLGILANALPMLIGLS